MASNRTLLALRDLLELPADFVWDTVKADKVRHRVTGLCYFGKEISYWHSRGCPLNEHPLPVHPSEKERPIPPMPCTQAPQQQSVPVRQQPVFPDPESLFNQLPNAYAHGGLDFAAPAPQAPTMPMTMGYPNQIGANFATGPGYPYPQFRANSVGGAYPAPNPYSHQQQHGAGAGAYSHQQQYSPAGGAYQVPALNAYQQNVGYRFGGAGVNLAQGFGNGPMAQVGVNARQFAMPQQMGNNVGGDQFAQPQQIGSGMVGGQFARPQQMGSAMVGGQDPVLTDYPQAWRSEASFASERAPSNWPGEQQAPVSRAQRRRLGHDVPSRADTRVARAIANAAPAPEPVPAPVTAPARIDQPRGMLAWLEQEEQLEQGEQSVAAHVVPGPEKSYITPESPMARMPTPSEEYDSLFGLSPAGLPEPEEVQLMAPTPQADKEVVQPSELEMVTNDLPNGSFNDWSFDLNL